MYKSKCITHTHNWWNINWHISQDLKLIKLYHALVLKFNTFCTIHCRLYFTSSIVNYLFKKNLVNFLCSTFLRLPSDEGLAIIRICHTCVKTHYILHSVLWIISINLWRFEHPSNERLHFLVKYKCYLIFIQKYIEVCNKMLYYLYFVLGYWATNLLVVYPGYWI